MRIQALAVAAKAVTMAALEDMPVVVTVWSVTVLTESCIIGEPGDVDLGEGRGDRNALVVRSNEGRALTQPGTGNVSRGRGH